MIQAKDNKGSSTDWKEEVAWQVKRYQEYTPNAPMQEQSPEAIALDGLLSDLEFTADRFQSMADYHWSNYKGEGTAVDYSREQSLTAFGIYANKAQDMRDLVYKWKPNKK